MWDEHTMCSATKKAQARTRCGDWIGEVHEAVKEGQEVHEIWDEHTMCSATKKMQVRKGYMDKMSRVMH